MRVVVVDEEIISVIIDGLDESYQRFHSHLHFNMTTSFDELVIHLLQEEHFLKRTSLSLTPLIAFMISNPVIQAKTWHINIDYHYMRDFIARCNL